MVYMGGVGLEFFRAIPPERGVQLHALGHRDPPWNPAVVLPTGRGW